ncbi:MAG: amidohydrolase [Melioribacteraceae bacterium]|nr:amidohydrolase [Melioribacteraceae bacterium]MCF8355416.1 amidohydrolase [Melioribacteraceae bacterium]MCF8393258.1 amidohydrolase [Melioribacteraceae bacterium]MCF8417559.1 amidohydrolase [Melioribacteraceae bacterium]
MKKRILLFGFVFTIMIFFSGCSEDIRKADLVLMNGDIYTVDESIPSAEAIAVNNDSIKFVGSNNEVKKYIGDKTEVIDLNGKFVMPGFIESHAHFMGLGKSKMILDLKGTTNYDELVSQVAIAAENTLPGEWILGRGWHQEKWDPVPSPNVKGYPVHTALSKASPLNPVILTHASGHAILVNAKAMELAGVTEDTPDPDGGVIVRDSLGNPAGVFEENAELLITNVYDEYRSQLTEVQLLNEKIRRLELAALESLQNGITTFHDAGETFNDIDLIKKLVDENRIPVRLYVMIGDTLENILERGADYRMSGYGDNHLTVRSIKEYMDGALGSRGAWLLSPYSDDSTNTGLNVTPLNELRQVYKFAIENDFQIGTHAIGDRANRVTLDLYERVFKDHPEKTNLRWRIEHAQHLTEKDIDRFAELNVIAAMQGVHCTSDAVFVKKRLGSWRAKTSAYVWRDLIENGVMICNGTDAPVESVSPIENFCATVTRKLADGTEFYPEQKMTREEAIKSYTINGAYAGFEEDIKGSITVNKLADFVVLSNNLLTVSDSQINNTKVLYTIIGGEVKYQSVK